MRTTANRDEFPRHIKEILAKRVGTLCSNPQCCVPTYGPDTEPTKGLSKGAAAHIAAAASGGPRFDVTMTPEQRASIDNGIWLCRSCADLIDKDPLRFSSEVLHRWKDLAEERARKALERPRIVNVGDDFADTVLLVTIHKEYPAFPESVVRGPRRRRKVTLRPIRAHRKLLDVQVPIVGGPPPGPSGYGKILLSCQNQGPGVQQFVRFGISFRGKSAIHVVEIQNERVLLSEGGRQGSSFASFFLREILPGEVMSASVVAKNDLPFDASLWTQNAGDSLEVFVYEVTIGEEELV